MGVWGLEAVLQFIVLWIIICHDMIYAQYKSLMLKFVTLISMSISYNTKNLFLSINATEMAWKWVHKVATLVMIQTKCKLIIGILVKKFNLSRNCI